MEQSVKAHASKPDNLSTVSGSRTGRGVNQLLQVDTCNKLQINVGKEIDLKSQASWPGHQWWAWKGKP